MLKAINYYIWITSLVALSRPRRPLVASEKNLIWKHPLYSFAFTFRFIIFKPVSLILGSPCSVLLYVLALIPEWMTRKVNKINSTMSRSFLSFFYLNIWLVQRTNILYCQRLATWNYFHPLFLTFCLRINYQSRIVIISCLFPLFNMLSKSIESWHMSVSWIQLEIADLVLNSNHSLKLIYNKWYIEVKDMS